VSAANVILAWDPAALRLVNHHGVGAVTLLSSGFPPDPFDLNELPLPQDGDGIYIALAPLGSPVMASTSGALLRTFQFELLAASGDSVVAVLDSAGSPPGETIVFDGESPNLDVTGLLGAAVVRVGCGGDLTGDGLVDLSDLGQVLQSFGLNANGDSDGDGDTDLADLALVLSNYGAVC
jgi:hypothetical protein